MVSFWHSFDLFRTQKNDVNKAKIEADLGPKLAYKFVNVWLNKSTLKTISVLILFLVLVPFEESIDTFLIKVFHRNSKSYSCFLELWIECEYLASLLIFFIINQYVCGILLTFSFIYVQKQMDLSYKITFDEEKLVIGIVRCREGCTFSEIHDEVVDDEIVG